MLFTVHELLEVSSSGSVVFVVGLVGVEKVAFGFVENVELTLKLGSIVLVRAVVLSRRGWLDLPVVLESLVVMVILGVKGEILKSLSSSCKWFGMVVVVVSSGSPALSSLRDKPAVHPNNTNSKTENSTIL